MIQSPADAGQLAPIGRLGVDADTHAGFDIYTSVRDGRTVSARGFAALTVGGRSGIYAVNLLTGAAHRTGWFPLGQQLTDLALLLDQD